MSAALAPWRAARAVHDPGKVLLDVAVAVALGGDCAAGVAVVRAQPALFGPVASDATVSRLISVLAGDVDAAIAQLPEHERAQVLVRTDTGGGVKEFLHHMTKLGLHYSVGFYGMPPVVEALARVPRQACRAAHNQIWLEIVALAADLLVWTQTLAFTDQPARRWKPKRLRLRLLSVAGRIISSGRRRRLRLPRGWPYNDLIENGWAAIQTT
jgi:hypothetical protein